jgi:hypothetical protein
MRAYPHREFLFVAYKRLALVLSSHKQQQRKNDDRNHRKRQVTEHLFRLRQGSAA